MTINGTLKIKSNFEIGSNDMTREYPGERRIDRFFKFISKRGY